MRQLSLTTTQSSKIHVTRTIQGKIIENHGGSLPLSIKPPNCFVDPTHRVKCVARYFFDMTKGSPSNIRATKLNALKMKKYYYYFIKQNKYQ